MKSILLSILFFGVQCKRLDPMVIAEWEEGVLPHIDYCVNITNVDWDIAKNMFRNVHLPDESTFHCYMKCIFDRQLLLNSNQELDQDQMLEKIYGLTPDLSQLCVDESAGIEDICVRIYNITKCIVHDIADD
ncbi:uncharacterized protein LOC116170161 [Photinus pyralis]|uniref:uncharacterized protein LOC116170146 n=1 Tax=Photinus pyralis TaxID=7054 RepID=UPI00126778E0|nr:uncharacterized protein LOC116170146 [Photinus pyralis]XP_031342239.1 uncharacterized protein LOC116170161 [Photinus pyralis]